LLPLAATLGADVPFFVGGHNAFVEGIGERLTAIPWAPRRYAVVKPAASLATRDIFEHPALARNSQAVILAGFLSDARHRMANCMGNSMCDSGGSSVGNTGCEVAGSGVFFGRNDLQPAAESLCSEVVQAADWLGSRFGNSRMTGSGSAVFAQVDAGDAERSGAFSGTNAQPLATFRSDELPAGWVGRMCRSLQEHPLLQWAS
jgi:4-diphosphocytidyl-2-C-methyl-D-erythritol kinase